MTVGRSETFPARNVFRRTRVLSTEYWPLPRRQPWGCTFMTGNLTFRRFHYSSPRGSARCRSVGKTVTRPVAEESHCVIPISHPPDFSSFLCFSGVSVASWCSWRPGSFPLSLSSCHPMSSPTRHTWGHIGQSLTQSCSSDRIFACWRGRIGRGWPLAGLRTCTRNTGVRAPDITALRRPH